MRALKITLIFVLILCLLAGCAGSPAPAPSSEPGSKPSTTPATSQGPALDYSDPELDYNKPGIDENYFDLYCEDMDLVYHVNDGGAQAVTFFFVSAQKLKNGDVQVSTDLGTTYDLPVEDAMNVRELPKPLFLSYQGFDWKRHAQVELEDPAEAEKQRNAYYLAYTEATQEPEKMALYGVKASANIQDLLTGSDYLTEDGRVVLPSGMDTLEIREITVTVKGQSKTYHPKRLCITTKPLEPDGASGGMFGTGAFDVSMSPSPVGKLTTSPMLFTARKDVTLTGFAFPDYPDNQALSCKLRITPPNGPFIDMDWDCKTPLELDAGSKLEAELTFLMPQYAGCLGGGGSLYISLVGEKDGAECYAPYHLVYALFSDPYEYYAQKHDGVDVMSYYRDYLAVIEAAKKEAE